MQRHGILHFLLFVIFFGVGAAGLGAAVLCDDLVQYCRNEYLLQEAQLSLRHLETLNADYDALLLELEHNPDLLKRIAPATLGTQPPDANTAYPKARAEELAVARKALLAENAEEPAALRIPRWLRRCSEPPKRILLFIAGASLVLISLVCFTAKASPQA
jgi:hypothetical protein